jgi:hypothetical protein
MLRSVIVIVIGLLLQGIPGATINVPAICEMIDTLRDKMGFDEEVSNNMASAMFNFAVNLGEAIGPTYGGYVAGVRSFETSCITTSFLLLLYGVIFTGYHYKSIKEYLDTPIEEGEIVENEKYPVSVLVSRRHSRASSINKEYVGRYRSMSYTSNLSRGLVSKK